MQFSNHYSYLRQDHFQGLLRFKRFKIVVIDLFLFCYERDFMKDLSSDNQVYVVKAFYSTSRYLDDLLNIDNSYSEGMINQFIHLNCILIKLILKIPRPPFGFTSVFF